MRRKLANDAEQPFHKGRVHIKPDRDNKKAHQCLDLATSLVTHTDEILP